MADISFIKDVKALKINGEPSHEYENGSDLMRVGGVRQSPRPNNVPVFRDNGYQLDFTVSTGGNINFNGTDYPQSTLITSFEAEGKTWLINEFSSNIIESETGDFATVSVNEGNAFLDSDVWQKKPFALEFDGSNQEYLLFDSSIVLSGDFELMFDLTSNINSTTQAFAAKDSDPKLFLWSNGRIYFQTDTDALYLSSNDILPRTGAFVYEIKRVGNDTTFYVDGALVDTISGFNGDITIDRICRRSGAYFDGELRGANIDGNIIDLKIGLGNEVKISSSITGELRTNHVDGMRRINYGMHLKGSNSDGWTAYD